MKIAILHDYIDKRGGGERLVLNLAKALNADIYTGFIDYSKTFEDARFVRIVSLNCRKTLPAVARNCLISKKFAKHSFPNYDFYIFSGVWCSSAAEQLHPNLLYLHTPARFLYDLKDYHLSKIGVINRFFAKLFIRYWMKKDQMYMKNFDKICPNSNNVKERVKKYYGYELYKKSVVVYTGFSLSDYEYKKNKDFYLSPCRLDALKRIDIIIEAFKRMPSRKLLITGAGPDETRLKNLADGHENIKFIGSVSNEELLSLYSTCKATISANVNEDLGLVPLESHASGKPSLVVNEGAFLETVTSKNGIFFSSNPESLIKAVEKCEKTSWNPKQIQKSAKKYDTKVFVKRIKKIINDVSKQY